MGEVPTNLGASKRIHGHMGHSTEGEGFIFGRLLGGKVGTARKVFLDEWKNKSKDTDSESAGYLEGNNG